jgi:hypothetical protein
MSISKLQDIITFSVLKIVLKTFETILLRDSGFELFLFACNWSLRTFLRLVIPFIEILA